TDDVVALLDVLPPPVFLEVALQLGPERTVVPAAVEAAVDLRRLKDETAPLAQADDFFHQGGVFLGGGVAHGVDSVGMGERRTDKIAEGSDPQGESPEGKGTAGFPLDQAPF